MNQDDKKRAAAERAISLLPKDAFIGVGTGSTVNYFIDALAKVKDDIRGAVATSPDSKERLLKVGIPVVSPTDAGRLPVYVDGADQINHVLQMIKGGGGALLSEKLIANWSEQFICIADDSKFVSRFTHSLPVEVIPFARSIVAQTLVKMGAQPQWRMNFKTEHSHEILDVSGLNLDEPIRMENTLNDIIGVMENGLFAKRPADVLVLANDRDTEIITLTSVQS